MLHNGSVVYALIVSLFSINYHLVHYLEDLFPYSRYGQITGFRLITEVMQRRAQYLHIWGTAWIHRVY